MRNKLPSLLDRHLTRLVFIFLVLLVPLLVAISQSLGEQFFLDSTLTNNVMKLFDDLNYFQAVETGESITFVNTGLVFYILGFSHLSVLWQGIVVLTISFTFIFFGLQRFSFSISGLIFLICALLPLVLFQGQLRKKFL